MSVSPEFTSSEEMSRLWSALQARYRPSATYKVSTVLLEADKETPQEDVKRPEQQEQPAAPTTAARPAARGARK